MEGADWGIYSEIIGFTFGLGMVSTAFLIDRFDAYSGLNHPVWLKVVAWVLLVVPVTCLQTAVIGVIIGLLAQLFQI